MSVIFSPVDWQGMMSNKLYNQFYTALHKSNFVKVKNLLVNEGLTANHQFADGSFPLHIAADHQECEILKFLLSLRASPDLKNMHGQTPLMLGIKQGRRSVEIVQALVFSDCKVNVCDSQKRTALHLAGGKGLDEVVEILLKAGARVNVPDKWGRTPLHVTLLNLAPASGGSRGAGREVPAAYVQVVRLLLAHGADANRLDNNDATPVFLAVQAGDICTSIVRLLIMHGAHPDKPGRHKLTPLQLSVMKGYKAMVRLLLEHNCNPNAHNAVTGKSPLATAVAKNHVEIAQLLVEAGASIWRERWIYSGDHGAGVTAGSALGRWLGELSTAPLSLKHMCRVSLRQHLPGRSLANSISRIQYPEALKQYILLRQTHT